MPSIPLKYKCLSIILTSVVVVSKKSKKIRKFLTFLNLALSSTGSIYSNTDPLSIAPAQTMLNLVLGKKVAIFDLEWG